MLSDQPQKLDTDHADVVCDGGPLQRSAEHPDKEDGQACCPVEQALSQQTAESAEQLLRLAEQYPKQSPYNGYRCDLVALLANLCFRRSAVQHKVQQLGGVELILSQCQVQPGFWLSRLHAAHWCQLPALVLSQPRVFTHVIHSCDVCKWAWLQCALARHLQADLSLFTVSQRASHLTAYVC